MGVGGVMALKVTGIVTITEIIQKTSGPPSQISLQEALSLPQKLSLPASINYFTIVPG